MDGVCKETMTGNKYYREYIKAKLSNLGDQKQRKEQRKKLKAEKDIIIKITHYGHCPCPYPCHFLFCAMFSPCLFLHLIHIYLICR